jgi:hypothetical protein
MKDVFKNWMKVIEKDNNAFNKANKARKRVMIAKDVIKALDAKLFTAGQVGGYFRADNHSGYQQAHSAYQKAKIDSDLRDLLIETNPSCDVCAKGAIFTCMVMRRDKVTKGDGEFGFNGYELSNKMDGIFSGDQLDLIECYYEGHRVDNEEIFGAVYGGPRLKVVMENIIKNNGTFIP